MGLLTANQKFTNNNYEDVLRHSGIENGQSVRKWLLSKSKTKNFEWDLTWDFLVL